jgi:hypothetical protein
MKPFINHLFAVELVIFLFVVLAPIIEFITKHNEKFLAVLFFICGILTVKLIKAVLSKRTK